MLREELLVDEEGFFLFGFFLPVFLFDQLGKGKKTQDRGITLLFIFPRAFKPKEANLEISKMESMMINVGGVLGGWHGRWIMLTLFSRAWAEGVSSILRHRSRKGMVLFCIDN